MSLPFLKKIRRREARTDDFDPAFYRLFYEDLGALASEQELREHFVHSGRAEGRHPNPHALTAALEARHGPLPVDFDPVQYRSLHPDLAILKKGWQLAVHYLQFGRPEKRPYGRDLSQYEADGAGREARTDDFDPAFYRLFYEDLGALASEQELREHFVHSGRAEGRHPNPHALTAALEARHGPLPVDFDPVQYRSLHPDLAILKKDWQLAVHYLQFGRPEKRPYGRDLSQYEAVYAELRAASSRGGALAAPSAETFEAMLTSHGLRATAWLECFNLGEFVLLNDSWLEAQPTSRVDGIRLFVEEGLTRLAPIAVRCGFDPGFYRTLAPTHLAEASDVELYRHWLNRGIGRSEPGTEADFLTELIGEAIFPPCFAVDHYRASLPGSIALRLCDRARLLDHFVRTGFVKATAEVVEGPGSARLYEQIGDFHLRDGDAGIAKQAFDRALAIEPPIGRLLHKRGAALRDLGRKREAVADFVAAADHPDAVVWSHIHAAEGLAELLDRPGEAVDQLVRSAPACRASAEWRAAGHRVLARFFAEESRRAHPQYLDGRREATDQQVGATLERVTEILSTIDPLPAALPRPAAGPIVLIANRDLPQCDHYRVVQRVFQLKQGGWSVELYDQHQQEAYRPALDRARAVIFYRVAAFPAILHAIHYARALGVPTIYEIDDLIFDPTVYPDPFESFEGQISPPEYASLQYGVPLFRHAMSLCETGLASTPALAESMRPLVRSGVCHVLRNGLDTRNTRFLDRPWSPLTEGTLTIFYGSGTKAHNSDFTELAAPALLAVMQRNPHVRVAVAGHLHLDARFTPFLDRVRRLAFTADVEAYWEVLSGVDINLAVLKPGLVADAKSEIKWLEAAMCAVPSIVSPTRTYREVLVDGENVLFAETPSDWTAALERLVSDTGLRRRIGEHARAKALSTFSLARAVETLTTVLPPPDRVQPAETAVERTSPWDRAAPRPAAAARKARLLFANVFFPPQTHGGATRVLRDNVDHLIDTASDRFDLAVIATDDGVDPPYETRIDSYRGIPVYRIAAPRAPNMDWRPFDPQMEAPFTRILERFDPDLVHLHCIQRLTGTIVEAVRERGTPYLVSVHDAWWISDFQFLVDADGQVDAPGPDPLAMATDPALSSTASIARRRRLGQLLGGSEGVIAVSETFAELYRTAGIANVRAIPNGLSRFTPLPRRARASGRVRLGHIGNRSAHKGATLVEAVLRQTRYENLALTIVDHAYEANAVREELWGTTPVRIIGPMPQVRIAELYAELDVLLAPSIWPESFGLVTREARAAGLWVVASDRGAIGEDVIENVNGFRIDVATLAGLRGALARIDADPALYRASPPPDQTARTAQDQAQDLMELYGTVLG